MLIVKSGVNNAIRFSTGLAWAGSQAWICTPFILFAGGWGKLKDGGPQVHNTSGSHCRQIYLAYYDIADLVLAPTLSNNTSFNNGNAYNCCKIVVS